MTARFLEDLTIGEVWRTGSLTVDEAAIRAFAGQYDPQPMHTDPEAAAGGFFGRLIGSGWQTACLTMRLVVESRPLGGTPLIGMEVGPIRFHTALLPGMSLTAAGTVTAARPLNSRPGYGIAQVMIETAHDGHAPLLSMEWKLLVPRRAA